MVGNWGLIDRDTPKSVYTKPSYQDGTDLQLVFSDEFNTEGRTFYPGDDPYWEAVDLHYWEVSVCMYDFLAVLMISSDEQHGMV
jgi:beta-glucan synthesis-associated protein KRE6